MSRDASQSKAIRTRPARTRSVRLVRLAVGVLLFYLAIALMLALLQRKLIYFPFKAESIAPRDAGLPVGRVHDIRVTTDDGLALYGWHVLAEGHAAEDREAADERLAEGRPVVLFFSGNGANRMYRVEEMRPLLESGADVFIVDYRGYGENEGSPSEQAIAADARRVWEYAVRDRKVAPERIVLYGESLGGAVAVRLAAEMCEAGTPPAGLIVRSTFSSLADVAAHHYPWLPVRLMLVEHYSSAARIDAVTCPVLFLHGNDDRIVPLKFGRKLFDAAPETSSRGVPKRFVELDGADHNGIAMTHDGAIRAAVADFLETVFAREPEPVQPSGDESGSP